MSGQAFTSRAAVLFALEREAAPFRRRAGMPAVVCGVGKRRTRAAVVHTLREHPDLQLVVMAGFCGALAPELRVGDVFTPADVADEAGNRWPCHDFGGSGCLLTTTTMIGDPTAKRRLGETHGAAAVDMESAAAAEACAERGVPFAAVRAVSDAVDTRLSPELLGLLSGGNVSAWKACRALARRPKLLPEFLRLARDTRRAADSLAAALHALLTRPDRVIIPG